MNNNQYELEKYKGPATKKSCPGCGHKNVFKKYISLSLGEYLADHVGRCDRENNCGYHYTPKQYFIDNPDRSSQFTDRNNYANNLGFTKTASIANVAELPVKYLPFEIMNKSVTGHKHSNLYPFLAKLFREEIASLMCQNYFIGSNKEGDTVFWQINAKGNVCQAKVMKYDPDTGRRNKDTGALFAGKIILKDSDANLQQCFFGEYLLSFPENNKKPVAIVESEKTAAIASVYFPGFIWLSMGGKHGAKWTEAKVCKVLSKRKVILFPDLGVYDAWKEKSLLLAATAGCKVAVSDLLESAANEEDKRNGLDLADYLLRKEDGSGLALTDAGYPVIFDSKN